MANLSRIVNVQIALNTTGVSQAGFSTGLIVGPHFHSLARVLSVTDVDELTDMGFSAADKIYLAVSDYLSQTPRPNVVKVGRLACQTVTVTVDKIEPTGKYSVVLSQKDDAGNVTKATYDYTNASGDAAAILKGLAGVITADKDALATAAAVTTTLTLTKKNVDFAVEVSQNLTAAAGELDEDIPTAMNAITGEDNDFYGIVLTSREPADILAMADWTESHDKLYLTAIAEAGAKDSAVSTDTGSKLMLGNYYRTSCWYHALAQTEFLDAALMSRVFSIAPGGDDWANKKLAGITADTLNETEFNALVSKNIGSFERFRNVAITQTGKVAAGEWLDIIRFRDWLAEQIKTNVFYLLINSDKVPYTDGGIAVIESVIRQALEDGQASGGIAPDEYDADGNLNAGYVLNVPVAAGITPNQKATRILPGIQFTARLAGAIHVVNISGSFTYDGLIQANQ